MNDEPMKGDDENVMTKEEQVLWYFLRIGVGETKTKLANTVPAGHNFPLVPGAQQSWTDRVDEQIGLLELSMSRFLTRNIEDFYVKKVLRKVFLFVRETEYVNLSRTVRNMCSLLDSGFEPVLILSGFEVADDMEPDARRKVPEYTLVTRLHGAMATARTELDLDAISDAPVEMFIEIMRSRFTDSMETVANR